MWKLPGTNKILELIGTLTSTVKDFAEREGKLNYALKLKSSNLAQSVREEVEVIERQLEKDIEEVTEKGNEERARLEARFDERRSRLGKAQISARKTLLDRLHKEEGYRKYEIQKHVIESGKKRDQEILEKEAAFQEKNGVLAEMQEKFSKLETAVQKSLRGYASVRKGFIKSMAESSKMNREVSDSDVAQLQNLYSEAGGEFKSFRGRMLPKLFGAIPISLLVVLILIIGGGLVPLLNQMKIPFPLSLEQTAGIAGAVLVLLLVLFFMGRTAAAQAGETFSEKLGESLTLRKNLARHFSESYESEMDAINRAYEQAKVEFEQGLAETSQEAGQLRASRPGAIEEKAARVAAKVDAAKAAALASVDAQIDGYSKRIRDTAEAKINEITGQSGSAESQFSEEHSSNWEALETKWKTDIPALLGEAEYSESEAEREFQPWSQEFVESWMPPSDFRHCVKFGSMKFDLKDAVESLPQDQRLALPQNTEFDLPLALTFPENGSILFETKNVGHDEAVASLNNLILRIFSGTPAGRAQFTIIDPVGLGQNFAGIMHLADHEEFLISSKIWTQPAQIEKQLSDLSDHMEKVIQMYLRNEYATITEYNEKAGNIAERYQFVVVSDFPHGFTEASAQKLLSIAATGARCGVYTLIHWDTRQQLPLNFAADDLRKSSVNLKTNLNGFFIPGNPVSAAELKLDPPPEDALAIDFVNRIGQASKDSNRVEVPFSQIAPGEGELWSEDTTNELRVPIGRTGATKLQYMAIGKGTCQHALIAGKTGSGKSTLFHVLITNLALWCDPDNVEFYLIDFKKGVEFKCYADAKLPHARVIAIESDREFGLSVLQRLDEELKRRGEIFRKMGVQDLGGYERAGGGDPIPRTLLLIDEFQEFFVEDDQVSQNAQLLLDRIVRQGRAFGIHAVLGSQTLGGAFTLARATLGQMVIRVALQCNEADAYLIMDDSNPAPRMLTRPGEGIYNDQAGAVQANSPFQVVWLGDEERDEWLAKTNKLTANFKNTHPAAVVFEGNAPADIADNAVLAQMRESVPAARPAAARLFLGAPNSIKGPTEVIFQRQSGNNLLIVGQREETVLGMVAIGIAGLKYQYPIGEVGFVLIDGNVPGSSESDYFDAVLPSILPEIERPAPHEIGDAINTLAAEMKRRLDDPEAATNAAPIFVFLNGLQKFKKLRYEEDFSFSMDDDEGEAKPDASLNDIITEGASVGIHLIMAVDSYNNVTRCMSRKAVTEFEMRVLFQMSANDSASLIDTVKASTLGLNRALFYNEQAGYLETFRPYSLPDRGWFEE